MKLFLIVLIALIFFGFFVLVTTYLDNKMVISDQTLFLSYRARVFWQMTEGEATNSLLVFPFLPFLGAILFPNPALFSAMVGTLLTIMAVIQIRHKSFSPIFLMLLLSAVVFSPAFLLAIVLQPVTLIFIALLLLAAALLLQYHETSRIHNCFLMGISLGLALFCRWETWWIVPFWALILIFFFSKEGIGKLTSLFLVALFPLAFFTAVLLFVNWVSTDNPLFFLQNSPFSYHALRGSFLSPIKPDLFWPWLSSALPFLLPFLVLLFHDRTRAVLATGFFFINFLGINATTLPVSAAPFALALPFLFPARSGTSFRSIFLVFLIGGLVFAWWRPGGSSEFFLTDPPRSYLKETLVEKAIEYQNIQKLYQDSPSTILIIDRDYHLLATWKDFSQTIVPENRWYGLYLYNPGILVDHIIMSREQVGRFPFHQFSRFWEGQYLEVYAR